MVNVVEQRIAELWMTKKRRDLSEKELDEMGQCIDWLTNDIWKQIKLENLSLLASMTNDVDWQHEICRRIDGLEPSAVFRGKRKKPGQKGTD